MSSGPREFLVLGAMGALAACSAGDSIPPPRRPVVQIQDSVGRVDQASLVGAWRCQELNPLPGAPVAVSTMTFLRDGSLRSEGRSEGRAGLGAIIVTATGKWRVDGERLVTSDVVSEAHSADNNQATDALLAIGSGIANNIMAQQKQGTSEVLTLSRTNLVTRARDVDDPPIVACTRA